ncbi:MAG: hypothetical protein Q613_PSC00247G0001 [Propionibacterium sp. DORA_15]|nr:MAG: hypothetical protein Q613_PSC00247G0001 [Propionibacterium sp. DORA_15]
MQSVALGLGGIEQCPRRILDAVPATVAVHRPGPVEAVVGVHRLAVQGVVIVQSLVDHLGTGEGDSLLLEGGLDTPVRIEDLGVGVAHGQADPIARTPSDGGQLLQCGIVLE